MLLGVVQTVLLVLLGLLALSDWIVERKPVVRIGIDATKPFHPYLGMAAISQGLFAVIRSFIHIRTVLDSPFVFLSALIGGVLLIVLGFVLAYPVAEVYLSRANQEGVLQRLAPVHQKLEQQQRFLAQLALLVGALHLTLRFFPEMLIKRCSAMAMFWM